MSAGSARGSGAAAQLGPVAAATATATATATPSAVMKRSEEARRRPTTTAISAQKARGATDGVKLTDELQDKQASNERRSQVEVGQQQQQQQVNKLVFGLNPRAHRARTTKTRTPNETTTDTVAVGQVEREAKVSTSNTAASLRATETGQTSGQTPVKRTSQVRASKYGNFYKPQDLTTTTTTSSNQSPITSGQSQAAAAATRSTMTKATGERAADKQSAPSPKPDGATGAQSSVRSSSRSPDRQRRHGHSRRGSFDEDISTIKLESIGYAATSSPSSSQPQPHETGPTKQTAGERSQQPILKTRTQFNILPPPQLSIATTGLGSVVNYAKSRIYDRPPKRILANPPEDTYSILDDRSGQIPASILSGFKPPKQVNVTKAREKWEGGEPFAKCKSRKRLAAQANRKLFPGTWSMTSVVATQQLHLQQALAQSASSANNRSRPLEHTDRSVKVLTRGSVLERVQQFEKVPSARGHLEEGSPLDGYEDDDEELVPYLSSASSGTTGSSRGSLASGDSNSLSRSSSSSSTASSSLGSDGAVAQQATKLATDKPNGQSKLKTASVQSQQASNTPSSETTSSNQQRRLSLRRRSSLNLRRGSTGSLIPKFYHPNGKPNTYEIEIQKRNIVACFDKFPERKAQLISESAINSALGRKQFHQIALACGYSEYFKVPLQRFVRFKLETDLKLAKLIGVSSNGTPIGLQHRKSSTVALDTNGTFNALPTRANLKKAASIESSSPKTVAGDKNIVTSVGQLEANDKKEINFVSCDQFLACWRELLERAYDQPAQFIHLLTNGQRQFLVPDDFVPLVQSIIDDHLGLKFLRAAPDFHMRYIQTVIARIYYNINRSWTGKISLQELRKSNLLVVLTKLAQEDDINRIRDYFSYEHFYVIYCKFWNLDQDHDLFISKEDLARHNDAAISSRIIERIFSGIVSKQIQRTARMSYADFVWFLLAEEDKKHPRSIEYWFRQMDLDGDGFISMYEMEYFYYEQTKRLELMNIEALPFLDSACQILDLVNPKEKNKISLADLKRTKMATIFFDTFINLEKYLEHESREFVSTRDIVQNGVVISDWDRFASEEYENLVTEESSV